MEPVNPDYVQDELLFKIGPPKGVKDEDCGTLHATHFHVVGGPFDGTSVVRTYWKPSEEELVSLNTGGTLEIDLYTSPQKFYPLGVGVG